MHPGEAFHMGWQSASAGYFFDGMEMIAALAPGAGGIEPLQGAVELLLPVRDTVNTRMDDLARLCSAAFGRTWTAPRSVDEYRLLLRHGVFEIVNRWSYIADIQTVNRLQAWFYAGFGLGRGETVFRGLRLHARLHEIVGDAPPLPDMPLNLGRMAREGARQMSTAAEEDDLRTVRPLFEDCARRLDGAARHCSGPLAEPRPRMFEEDLAAVLDTARRVELDFAGRRN